MTSIQKFTNVNLRCELRILDRDGNPWFVAKDVCDALGYRDTNDGTKYLDNDEVSTCPDKSSGQTRNLTILSEPGLYSLILRSRKTEAKAFKRWVTHEVLPAIRKAGRYVSDSGPVPYAQELPLRRMAEDMELLIPLAIGCGLSTAQASGEVCLLLQCKYGVDPRSLFSGVKTAPDFTELEKRLPKEESEAPAIPSDRELVLQALRKFHEERGPGHHHLMIYSTLRSEAGKAPSKSAIPADRFREIINDLIEEGIILAFPHHNSLAFRLKEAC